MDLSWWVILCLILVVWLNLEFHPLLFIFPNLIWNISFEIFPYNVNLFDICYISFISISIHVYISIFFVYSLKCFHDSLLFSQLSFAISFYDSSVFFLFYTLPSDASSWFFFVYSWLFLNLVCLHFSLLTDLFIFFKQYDMMTAE